MGKDYTIINDLTTMRLKVLAFGVAKDIFEGDSIEIDAEGHEVTCDQLKKLLEERYPRLKRLSSFMLAVNNDYSYGDQVIREADEIAVIPPVSGG